MAIVWLCILSAVRIFQVTEELHLLPFDFLDLNKLSRPQP